MKGFGQRLKTLRKEANITQTELAEKLDVHSQTISRWERDISEPDIGMYGIISQVLCVSLEELCGISDQKEKVNGNFDLIFLGKTIAFERKSLGESQDVLANVAGVSADIISKWERGLISPDIDTLLLLANHFGISPSELYYAKPLSNNIIEIHAESKTKKLSKKAVLAIIFLSSVLLIAVVAVILIVFLKPFNSSSNEVSICQHDYKQEIVNASCTSQGYTIYTCEKCGDSYMSDYTAMIAHVSGEWITDREPTCTETGSKHRQCTICGAQTETAEIDKIAHQYRQEIIPATCTAQGNTTYTCANCGDSYNSDYTAMIAHTSGEWITDREPTCTETGSKHRQCTICGAQTETAEIDKIAHQYQQIVVPSSCTMQGYTEYMCEICGYSYQSNFTVKLEHIESDWITDRAATCAIAGSRHKECSVCHITLETAVIDKLAHSYTVEIVPPEGDHQGYYLYTCDLCGDSYKDNYFLPDDSGLKFTFDYSSRTCEVIGIDENTATRIEIPSTVNGCKVTTIGWRAFGDCVTLREIMIPDTVESIGAYAFYRCVLLKEVVIPDSVTEIGDEAFCGCRGLERAVLPARLTRIRYSTFSDCVNLKTVNIPSGVAIIDDLAFHNCTKLNGIILPEGLLNIGREAFLDCKKLEEINIPQSVFRIGDIAFSGCTNLTSVEFGQPEGWIADEIVIDGESLADKRTAAEYLTVRYNTYIWVRN